MVCRCCAPLGTSELYSRRPCCSRGAPCSITSSCRPRFSGLDKVRSRARAMDLINLVGLSGFEKRFPRELSGGMQQRVSLCRALIHNPSVLLMDEPFAALDAMTREELCFELMRIWNADKKTVIFVTHNITEAILLADRVVAMTPRPGRIARIVEIELPRPRTIAMEFTPAFKSYSDQIRDVIYQGQGAARA